MDVPSAILCAISVIITAFGFVLLGLAMAYPYRQSHEKPSKNVYQAMMDDLSAQDKHRLDMQRDFNTRWENYPRK